MKIGVSLKIDVSKIDKALLFKGAKGVYLDAKVFIDIDQKDQYDNNGMITQEVGQGQDQGAILGNCKVFWNDSGQQQVHQQQPQQQGGFQKAQQGFQQQQSNQQQSNGFGGQQQQTQQGYVQNNQQTPKFEEDTTIPF